MNSKFISRSFYEANIKILRIFIFFIFRVVEKMSRFQLKLIGSNCPTRFIFEVHYSIIFSNTTMSSCQDEISVNDRSTAKTGKIAVIG